MTELSHTLPQALIDAVRAHQLVPFVGAGVSMGVAGDLFPSWPALLEGLVAEMTAQAADHQAVNRAGKLIAADEYVLAAEIALRELGPYRFNRFLRARFRKPRPPAADLTVPRAIWALGPPVVITTNYDPVMRWAADGVIPNLDVVANDQSEELALLATEARSDWPWLWHVHGTIDRLATVILAGSDYRRLYQNSQSDRRDSRVEHYEHALMALQSTLASRPFLYVGFSLNDPYVLQQIEQVLALTRNKNAPSYALMKRGQGDRAALWANYNIQLIEYPDHGAPLADLLHELCVRAFGPATEVPVPVLDGAPGERHPPANRRARHDAADHRTMEDMVVDAPDEDDAFLAVPERASGQGAEAGDMPAEQSPAKPAVPAASARPGQPMGAAPVPHVKPVTRSPDPGPVAPVRLDKAAGAGADPPRDGRPPESVSPAPPPPASAPDRTVTRDALQAEYAAELGRGKRLLVLAPRKGGARTMARLVAARYDGRVTRLSPPNVPSCSEGEYVGFLTGGAVISGFFELQSWLRRRAGQALAEHLVVLQHDGGPEEHLQKLGNVLRTLMDESRCHVLVAGEARCAWLRLNTPAFSLFSGAPVRYVPGLAAAEIAALLPVSAAHVAEAIRDATAGHPGMVAELVAAGSEILGAGDRAAVLEAATARLSASVSVRGVLARRLAADDRDQVPDPRHARTVLRKLCRGEPVARLEDLQDDLSRAEVRLYYDGLVVADSAGNTVFRCAAVEQAVARLMAGEG